MVAYLMLMLLLRRITLKFLVSLKWQQTSGYGRAKSGSTRSSVLLSQSENRIVSTAGHTSCLEGQEGP